MKSFECVAVLFSDAHIGLPTEPQGQPRSSCNTCRVSTSGCSVRLRPDGFCLALKSRGEGRPQGPNIGMHSITDYSLENRRRTWERRGECVREEKGGKAKDEECHVRNSKQPLNPSADRNAAPSVCWSFYPTIAQDERTKQRSGGRERERRELSPDCLRTLHIVKLNVWSPF